MRENFQQPIGNIISNVNSAVLQFANMEKTCQLEFPRKSNETQNQGITPIIVRFSNGTLNLAEAEKVKFSCFRKNSGVGLVNLKANPKNQYIITAETDRLTYVNDYENGKCNSNYFLGIFSKKTKKMKVLPTYIYQLSPFIGSSEEDKNSQKSEKGLTFNEKINELTTLFGSKRKRQQMESRMKYEVKSDNLVNIMNKTAGEIAVADTNTETTDSTHDIIPTINRSATRLEDVYNLEEILPNDLTDALEELVPQIVNSTPEDIENWHTNKTFSSYILNQFAKLPVHEEQRHRKVILLLCLHFLLLTFGLKYSDLRRKEPFPKDIPSRIKEILLDNFTQQGISTNRAMPQQMKEKVLARIIILGLIIDEFDFTISLIPEIKTPPTRIVVIGEALGAKVTTVPSDGGKITRIKLKLPIPKVTQSLRMYKKRKQ